MATRNPFYTSTLGIHLYLRGIGAPRYPLSQASSALEASCYSPQKISRNPIKPFLCSPLPFCLLCNLRCSAPPEPLSVVLSSYAPSANTTNILFDRVLPTLYYDKPRLAALKAVWLRISSASVPLHSMPSIPGLRRKGRGIWRRHTVLTQFGCIWLSLL